MGQEVQLLGMLEQVKQSELQATHYWPCRIGVDGGQLL